MAFTERITLQDETPADQHYDVVSTGVSSTVRGDAARDLQTPMGLTISHQVDKDGARVNTLVKMQRTELDGDLVSLGNATVHLKLQYDVNIITSAQVQEMTAELIELLTSANITKLLNREH